MYTTQESTNLTKGFRGAPLPLRLLAILSLVVVMAASCSSDTAAATADDTGADEQSDVTTTTPEAETTTTAEPEPEPVLQEETPPAPDATIEATIVSFTEAFGVGDAEEAWTFNSVRCQDLWTEGSMELRQDYRDSVAGYAAAVPEATALNVEAVVDGNTAGISYDVHNGSGEFVESYFSQPWIFEDGQWLRDAC